MTLSHPRIDERQAKHLAQQAQQLLRHYAPEWKGQDDPHARALIAVFARFGELIIERLNRVPEKNLLAFLDLLGASRAPPQPARVPLTFRLAAGGNTPARVPAGTQVASAAPAADGEPVIFETERDLVVTPARLAMVLVHDPANERYRDLATLPDAGAEVFAGDTPMPHEFYIDCGPLQVLPFDHLSLMFEFEKAPDPQPLDLTWHHWDGSAWAELKPSIDGTAGLSSWGALQFDAVSAWPSSRIAGVSGTWLRCSLRTLPAPASLPGAFTFVPVNVMAHRSGVAPEQAFADTQALDLGQDIFPFGERPRFGAAFHLASPLFGLTSSANAHTLAVTVTDPKAYLVEEPGLRTIPAQRSKPTLAWEAWDGERWQPLAGTVDGTEAFTKSGTITLGSLPSTTPPRPGRVHGVEGCWVRARITGGDYGREALQRAVIDSATKAVSYQVEAATLVPPAIGRIAIDSQIQTGLIPLRVITHNQLIHRLIERGDGGLRFQPFELPSATQPALYLGFELPPGCERFADAAVALHAGVAPLPAGEAADRTALPPRVSWEYRGAAGWSGLIVRDETQAFTRSGAIEWLPPDDFSRSVEFGERALHWVRARWSGGSYRAPPRLQQLLLNTAPALQALTIHDELLGSSDGGKDQRYRCTHAPVFAGTQLGVREPERPSALELEALARALGAEPALVPGSGSGSEVWVPWQEVADFYASGPRDRHYAVDHLRGEIRFGDGAHGLVPPRGIGNVRLERYRSGGGARGNLPAGSVTQLRTTLAYVDGVEQQLPAEGGADAEELAALLERAPRRMRHGGRAVTRDDFEDLAQLASPEVARAKCVPLWDALATPLFLDTERDRLRRPGHLTLIVVPRSTDAKPLPSQELVERVRAYLEPRCDVSATFGVVGPRYVQVDIEADVVPLSIEVAGGLEGTVARALAAFLHPLTGGFAGSGWPWGRRPHESDFHRCIGAVRGVDHVHRLVVTERPEIQGLTDTDHFLVHSGTHHIRLRSQD